MLKSFLNWVAKNSEAYKKLEKEYYRERREEENKYYQKWIDIRRAMEEKTVHEKGKCPLCGLDKRLYNIPSNVLGWLTSRMSDQYNLTNNPMGCKGGRKGKGGKKGK